jgi:tRNA threonylcarbamoyladenosine biosynthesis protein TsaB
LHTLLAFDTSTAALTVAVAFDGRIAAETTSRSERNHSMRLVPIIRDLLKSAGTSPDRLDGIAVGVGPGSYTGVRIGVTVAKTMAWALNVPVIGVSGLEALARGGLKADEAASDGRPRWYVPLLDARRGQAYTAAYVWEGAAGWRCAASDAIRPVDGWLAELEQMSGDASLVFVGEAGRFAESVDALARRRSAPVRAMETEMRAADIAEIGMERWTRGERDDAHALIPNYTQPPEAEVKFREKEKREVGPFGGAC